MWLQGYRRRFGSKSKLRIRNQLFQDIMFANPQVKWTVLTVLAQICQKSILESEFQLSKSGSGISTSKDTMCAIFQTKQTTSIFSVQISPKTNLGLGIPETNVGLRISILEIPCVPIFRRDRQLWLSLPKSAQKLISGSKFQTPKSRSSGISISKISCIPIFSQNGQLWIFGVNLGKLSN